MLEQKINDNVVVDNVTFDQDYDMFTRQLASCEDLVHMTESEILEQLQSKIDIQKEEEQIEAFIKSKQVGDGNLENYGIYKLKTLILHEKLKILRDELGKKDEDLDSFKQKFEEDLKKTQTLALKTTKLSQSHSVSSAQSKDEQEIKAKLERLTSKI